MKFLSIFCQTLAKLLSCVEEMQNVVGDTISENMLIRAAKLHDYDIKSALDSVLNAHTFNNSSNEQNNPKPLINKGIIQILFKNKFVLIFSSYCV